MLRQPSNPIFYWVINLDGNVNMGKCLLTLDRSAGWRSEVFGEKDLHRRECGQAGLTIQHIVGTGIQLNIGTVFIQLRSKVPVT